MKRKQTKYVLLDIFDTIVSRKVQPEYVKKIWSNNIVKMFKLDITAVELYELRNKIEIKLGSEALNSGHDCEIRYKDIIKEIYDNVTCNDSFDEFLETCTKEEIDIESNVLYVNDDVLDLIKEYKNNKKKLYCVSDMYLSKNMIIELLKKLDIDNYFEDVFVSSEYLCNKRSGLLYDIVLKEIKARPEECLMIGDSKEKDYDMPKAKGMEGILLDRNDKYEYYDNFISHNNPEIVANELRKLRTYNNYNFNNMIFSLYNFIDKLYFKLKKEKYDEVFFLAREGEFLKKLFDYYVCNSYNEKIKSHYLYVSRKSTYLPSLKKIEEEDFLFLLNQYSYVTIREFIKSLNFSDEDIKLIEDDLKDLYDFDTKIGWFMDSKQFKKIKDSKVFRKIYEKNRSNQNELFKKYINQFTKSKRIMIVDIGWNGSIQDNIQNILGKEYEVSGCYFGLCLRNRQYTGKKTGLVFSNDPSESKEYRLYFENRTLYEMMCGASHGSANKYTINKNGKVETLLFSKKEEEDMFKNIVQPAQVEMFDIFERITRSLCNKYYDNTIIEKIFNEIQFNLLYKPSKEQLEFFDKMYHYENFGVFEFTTFTNKKKLGFKKYVNEHIKFFRRRYKTNRRRFKRFI